MNKDSASRRAWIKNFAIIFLVILLLLTFFSNTILNHSLPEVSAQYAQYATLSTAVKVNGTVKANESYRVVFEEDQEESMPQSRKVLSVFVKEGNYVSKDDVILTLSGGPSVQLENVEKDLAEKKKAYELALLDDGVNEMQTSKNLSDAKKEIEKAQADLKKAEAELAEMEETYRAILSGTDVTTIIEAAIKNLQQQIKDKESAVKTVNKSISDIQNKTISELQGKISELSGKLAGAKSEIDEDTPSSLTYDQQASIAGEDLAQAERAYYAQKEKVDELAQNLETMKNFSDDMQRAHTIAAEIKGYEESLASLEKQAARDEEDYNETLARYRKTRDDSLSSADESYRESLQAINDSESEALQAYYESVLTSEDPMPPFNDITYAEQREKLARNYDKQVAGIWEDYNEQVDALTKTYNRSKEDRDEQIDAVRRQLEDAQAKLYVIDMPEVDDVIDYEYNYDLAAAQAEYDRENEALTGLKEKYEKAKETVESLQKKAQAQGKAAQYQAELDSLNGQVDYWEKRIEELEAQIEALNEQKAEIEEKLSDKREELSEEKSKIKNPDDYKESMEAKKEEIETKKEAIADLQGRYEISAATNDKAKTETALEREEQKKEISDLEEKIEAYRNAPETTEVKAPIAGRVVSVNFVPGDTVTSGNTVASIEISDKGYVVEINLPAEQARKIQVGAPCTVTNSWWYSNITASVTQIKPDPQSQGKNRIIVITVSGDVTEGQSLNFSIGDRSQSYDSVLPNSAIREDNDGKYVLTVESMKTPLGMRYTAKRTAIEVLASDDTQTAVGGLYGSEFVITSSTSPISNGQQVRLAGN